MKMCKIIKIMDYDINIKVMCVKYWQKNDSVQLKHQFFFFLYNSKK